MDKNLNLTPQERYFLLFVLPKVSEHYLSLSSKVYVPGRVFDIISGILNKLSEYGSESLFK